MEPLQILDLAIRQDRERFFKIADSLFFQPAFSSYMSELETIKQQWRDITELSGYPNIDFPPELPDWFPEWQFMNLIKDETLLELSNIDES